MLGKELFLTAATYAFIASVIESLPERKFFENLNFCSNTGHRFYSSNHLCHRVVDYENRGTIIKYYLDQCSATPTFFRSQKLKVKSDDSNLGVKS
mgnify:CR=1 FL=1